MLRKLVLLVTSFTILMTLVLPTNIKASTTDIDGHYFEYELNFLIEKGILNGYGDGVYLPNKNVTRAEFASLLVNAIKVPSSQKQSSFKDVKSGTWYYGSVMAASEAGLIAGYGDKTFRPNQFITNEQMAAMIKRALDYKGVLSSPTKINFADYNKINPIFVPSIQHLVYLNIFADGNNFGPRNETTRGQVAAILHRTLNVIANPKEIVSYTNYNYSFDKMVQKQAASPSPAKVDGAGQYTATPELIRYYVNPSNFKKGTPDYLQFLSLSQSTGISAKELNDKVLYDKGIFAGRGQDFIDAGKAYNVNEIYLIAHALHETGNGTSDLATGIRVEEVDGEPVDEPRITYNMYGIGAVDAGPNKFGSERAYKEGWFTPREAIIGGAYFIAEKYISVGQDTLYKMRWNPDKPATHQYATHVQWATAQTTRMNNMYQLIDNYVLKFDVPKFTSQPGPTAKPTGIAKYAVDTTRAGEKGVTTAVDPELNLRTGPTTTEFAVIDTLSEGTEITVIGENGGWFKVNADGQIGWVDGRYVNFDLDPVEENGVQVASVHTFVGETDLENQNVEGFESENVSKLESIESEVHPEVEQPFIDGIVAIGKSAETVIRDLPSASEGNEIHILPEGELVNLLYEETGFYLVELNNVTGWIAKEDLEFVNVGTLLDDQSEEQIIVFQVDDLGELTVVDDAYLLSLDDVLIAEDDVTLITQFESESVE